MNSPKPRYWNQAALENFLGGSAHEVTNVRRALTQLMKKHDKLYRNYKLKNAKNDLQKFILSNLDQLPELVHDASSNEVRMEGLMGLAYKVNNMQKQYGRDKVVLSQIRNTPPEPDPFDAVGESDSDDETNVGTGPEVNKASDGQLRPAETNGSRGHDSVHDTSGAHDARSEHSRASANYSSPAVIVDGHAEEPPSKRLRTIPPPPPPPPQHQHEHEHQSQIQTQSQPEPQPPGISLLARNIWVVNEVDHENHGLCPISELVTKENPRIPDLDFDHWVLIAQAQCGYNYTIHRLEYRPSPTAIMPLTMGRPITIPMQTPSQWRGALNSQLQASPDQDPVFYMVYQAESRPEPSSSPEQSPPPSSAYISSQIYQPATRISPTVKQEFVEELPGQRSNMR